MQWLIFILIFPLFIPTADVAPIWVEQELDMAPIEDVQEPEEPTIYVQFVMNTHDWVMLDEIK